MEKEGGISDKLDRILDTLESEESGGKDFKLPASKRMGEKRKIKKNNALVIVIKTNGNFDIRFIPIRDDLVYLKQSRTYHDARTRHIGYYKKYPVLIIPEWDLEPLSRASLYKEAEEGRLAKAQAVIIHNVEQAMGLLNKKKSMAGAGIILLIIGGGALIYMLYQAFI